MDTPTRTESDEAYDWLESVSEATYLRSQSFVDRDDYDGWLEWALTVEMPGVVKNRVDWRQVWEWAKDR